MAIFPLFLAAASGIAGSVPGDSLFKPLPDNLSWTGTFERRLAPYKLLMYRDTPPYTNITDCLAHAAALSPPINYLPYLQNFSADHMASVNQENFTLSGQRLTWDELFAIYLYTSSSANITTRLRTGDRHGLTCYLRYLISGFAKLSNSSASNTWHGVSRYRVDETGFYDSRGELIVWPGDLVWAPSLTSTAKLKEVSLFWIRSAPRKWLVHVMNHSTGRLIEPLVICEYRWQSEVLFLPQALFIVKDIKREFCAQDNSSKTWVPTYPDPYCPVSRQEYGGEIRTWDCRDAEFDGSSEFQIAEVEELTKDVAYDWVNGSDPIEAVQQECDNSKFAGLKWWKWLVIAIAFAVVMFGVGFFVACAVCRRRRADANETTA